MRPAKLTDEAIVALLREAERGEKPIAQLARENEVTEQTIYRWRRKFGGSTVPNVRRLKQLEKDNARLLIPSCVHKIRTYIYLSPEELR